MGSVKEQFMNEQNDRNHQEMLQKIADYLELQLEDVERWEPEINDNLNNDDVAVGYIIEFPDDSPQHIKEKLENGKYLYVELNFFGNDYSDDDYVDEGYVEEGSGFVDLSTDFVKKTAEEANKKKEQK